VARIVGSGEMAERIRRFDWASTPLGPIDAWPQSLVSAMSICVGSRFPIIVWWGPELRVLYNDAYIPVFARKHPTSLGRPGLSPDAWGEVADVIGPRLRSVLATGEATWEDDHLLVLERNGYPEECYFTYSYSPIRDETGAVGGVFSAVSETTGRVVGARRLRTLRDLGARAAVGRTAEEACRVAAAVLDDDRADLPFATIHLLDEQARVAHLGAAVGAEAGSRVAPALVALDDASDAWGFGRVVRAGVGHVVRDPLPRGPWPEPTTAAVVLPLAAPGQSAPAGFLVAGVSPRRALDADYAGFLDLVAGHVATAVANARGHEEQRRRAEALAELDRAKTAFFSNVSHEFRTPLTLMLGPLEDALAERDERLGPRAQERLGLAHRNSLRLLRLVNTLLDFSRIVAGGVVASFEPTPLGALTSELASSFRSAMERAGLAFRVECPEPSEPIHVDRAMWEKIVLNLLSNAFKFTLAGRVDVALLERADAVELAVADSGCGIPAPELPHVFQRFHRVAGTRGRTHEGTGIGLALVHELVKLHGGAVTVDSRVGEGTTFRVVVPKGVAHLPAERIGAARALASTAVGATPFVEEALRWLPAAADEPVATVTAHRGRVVVADDNADMRQYLLRLLSEQFEVEACDDGQAALAAALVRPPDLVLTDVMMPGLDGFGLLAALRADPRTRGVPVVLLSARAGEEARVEALHAGADDYLVKPFSARELVARVTATLALARARMEAVAERATLVEREHAARRQAATERENLIALLRHVPAPVAIVQMSSEHVLAFANRLMLDVFAHDEDVIGRPLFTAVPELREPERWQGLLEQVRTTGAAYVEYDARVTFDRGGVDEHRWFTFVLSPMFDAAGAVEAVLVVAFDVTATVRARQEAERLRAVAEAASRAKDEFLAMLGHELRNPLSAVRNAVAAAALDPARRARALDIARRQTDQLNRLVDDLLDVARITRGRIALRRRRVAVAEVVANAVEAVRDAIDERGHRLTVQAADASLAVDADPTRLEQVVVNLLRNAAKYTEPGGAIELAVRRDGDAVVLAVRDSGVGIAADVLPRVFDLFAQARPSLDRSLGGLGVGLTVARRLVELHGGTIAAHSEGLGRGAEFVVRLPGAAGADAAGTTPAGAVAAPSTPMRVLVVEDNHDAAESLVMLLEVLGHRVRVAPDGPTALAAARGAPPDVVLLDIGLPGIDGYEVARRMRADPLLRRVVLVALTGYGRSEDRAMALAAGFDHHLVKPVEPGRLEALLGGVQPAGPGSRAAG
jgi:signal transduction histidine kinase